MGAYLRTRLINILLMVLGNNYTIIE